MLDAGEEAAGRAELMQPGLAQGTVERHGGVH